MLDATRSTEKVVDTMRVYLPQFDPSTPALSHTQVGSASMVVANAGVFTPVAQQDGPVDVAAERLLLATFGAAVDAQGQAYEQLRPAYLLGWRAAVENPAMRWEVLQRHLPAHWEMHPAFQQQPWPSVQAAVQAGWALAVAQPLDDAGKAVRQQQIDVVDDLLNPLIRDCMALVRDVQALLEPTMLAFPLQVLERHVHMLEGFAQELQWLANGVEVSRPRRLGWWLRQRGVWLRLQGHLAHWHYKDVMQLCEQREQQLLCSYRSASTDTHSQVVRQVLLHQKHDLQRNMEKLCWVRTHWVG